MVKKTKQSQSMIKKSQDQGVVYTGQGIMIYLSLTSLCKSYNRTSNLLAIRTDFTFNGPETAAECIT
jgi:hypothetical protein